MHSKGKGKVDKILLQGSYLNLYTWYCTNRDVTKFKINNNSTVLASKFELRVAPEGSLSGAVNWPVVGDTF